MGEILLGVAVGKAFWRRVVVMGVAARGRGGGEVSLADGEEVGV